MIYIYFKCLKNKFLLFLLYFYVKQKKPLKNKNIDPHQNTTISYKKSLQLLPRPYLLCISRSVITFLIPLIFLKIIKKKYDSSAELLCTHFCHQTFSLYIIGIPFSSLLLFPFFWFFLFFCLFFFKPLTRETVSLLQHFRSC